MGGMLSKPKPPKPVVVPEIAPPPPAPVPEPVAAMPVPDDLATDTSNKKKAARRIMASGRASTVLSGDGLGGT